MNVELIKIDAATARAKLVAYRKGIAARAHGVANERVRREYEQIEAGYKAAAKGLPLIMLSEAMKMGGWDAHGRPKFAVARADQRSVSCSVHSGIVSFSSRDSRASDTKFRFTAATIPRRPTTIVNGESRWFEHYSISAIVPMVPPDVLKRQDCNLSRRAILWEAEWKAPPVDPMLLLPIGGDLYAVEAAWDLTPLERAVIAGRAS